MSKKAIVVATSFALKDAVSSANEFLKDTKSALRNNAKMLSYENQRGDLKRRLGSKIKSIVNAFNAYERQVSRGIKRGVSINALVTKQAITEIVLPYESYIRKDLGSKSLPDSVKKMEEQRKKDLDRFGVDDSKIEAINDFYDWKIKTFILPLQFIELKLNELTGGKRKSIQSNSGDVLKKLLESATEVEVIDDAVEEHSEYTKKKAEERKAKEEEKEKITPENSSEKNPDKEENKSETNKSAALTKA